MLALRVHAIDIARAVLRTCQQLHGAAGVCDEYDISVLTRHIQPALRLPFGAERTAAELADAIAADGFVGPVPARRIARVTIWRGPPLDDWPGIGALTMGGFLDEVAERFGGNEALVFDDRSRRRHRALTYAELLRGGARSQGADRGGNRGDRVAILMGNRPEAVAASSASCMAGGVAVPLSTFATEARNRVHARRRRVPPCSRRPRCSAGATSTTRATCRRRRRGRRRVVGRLHCASGATVCDHDVDDNGVITRPTTTR